MALCPEPIRFSQAPREMVLSGSPAALDAALAAQREEEIESAHQRGWEEASSHYESQLLEQRNEFAEWQEMTLKGLADQHAELVAQFTAALVPLAGQIVQRLLAGYEPSAEQVAKIVSETLAEVEPGTPEVEVVLSPHDCEVAQSLAAEHGQRYPGLRLRADDSLRPGDCRLQSRFGAIDARLITKLGNIMRSLT